MNHERLIDVDFRRRHRVRWRETDASGFRALHKLRAHDGANRIRVPSFLEFVDRDE